MANQDTLSRFAGSLAGFLQRRSQRQKEEKERQKQETALKGVVRGLHERNLISEQMGADKSLAEAQKFAQQELLGRPPEGPLPTLPSGEPAPLPFTGYRVESDPRYQFLVSRNLQPAQSMQLARMLYQTPRAPKRFVYEYKGLGAKGKKDPTAYAKWQDRMDELRKERLRAFNAGDLKTVRELEGKLGFWERKGVEMGLIKSEGVIWTTKYKELRKSGGKPTKENPFEFTRPGQ